MKQLSIKYTKDYLLLIEKVYGFKVGDWNYEEDNTIPVYQFDYNIDEYPGNKIIAYYPLTKEAKELDLPLLPNPFEDNFDLKQEIIRWYHSKSGTTLINDPSLNQIIDKAQSKQFSLEDVENILIKYLEEGFISKEQGYINPNSFLKSITTQQLPVSFEPEYRYYYHSSKELYSDAGFVECSKEQYESIKAEIPTCPLKVEIKTIINAKRKLELVGTYKY